MITELSLLAKEAIRLGINGNGWKILASKCLAVAILKDDPLITFGELGDRVSGGRMAFSKILQEENDRDLQPLFELWPGSLEAYVEMDELINKKRKE